jgi:hypothetical protein
MTKQNLTDITILLDKSSSMSGSAEKTRNAINEFILGQKTTSGDCNISLYTFSANDRFDKEWLKTVWEGLNIKEINELSKESYRPNGNTALYDATGEIIERTGARFAKLSENQRPEKVLFVIMTDGEENSSRQYTLSKLKEMINHQENKYSWNFLFLGADFNTEDQTKELGLDDSRSYNFSKNDLVKSFKGLSRGVSAYRTMSGNNKLGKNFSKSLEEYADKENNTVTGVN